MSTSPSDPSPRWSGAEIVFIVLACYLWPSLVGGALLETPFPEWMYGDEYRELLLQPEDTPERKLAQLRWNLWSLTLAFPFQIGTILLVLAAISGSQPEEIGLHPRRAGRNALGGLLALVVLGPGVFGLQALSILIVKELGLGKVAEHPFTLLGQGALSPIEWVMLISAAVIIAPVLEEILFRGLVQPYLCATPLGGYVGVSLACGLGCLVWASSGWTLQGSTPALVPLVFLPVVWLLMRRGDPAWPGFLGTAVLFGWVHARTWPTPIPLTLLALGLGWLALKGRSLVGPIVLHSAFNGVSCVLLLIE